MADPVGAIKLEYPVVTPTTTLFLRPGEAGLTILRDAVEPVQWLEEAVSGTVTFKQLGTYKKERWRVTFQYLLDTETGAGLSGFNALRTFLETTVDQAANIFKITDRDGEAITCRLIPGSFQWERGRGRTRYIYHFGSFSVLKVT